MKILFFYLPVLICSQIVLFNTALLESNCVTAKNLKEKTILPEDTFPLKLIKKQVKHTADYHTEVHFTVQNISKKTIVAFEIGLGDSDIKRFKKTINPNEKFSSKVILKADDVPKPNSIQMDFFETFYDVRSVIFSDGRKVKH